MISKYFRILTVAMAAVIIGKDSCIATDLFMPGQFAWGEPSVKAKQQEQTSVTNSLSAGDCLIPGQMSAVGKQAIQQVQPPVVKVPQVVTLPFSDSSYDCSNITLNFVFKDITFPIPLRTLIGNAKLSAYIQNPMIRNEFGKTNLQPLTNDVDSYNDRLANTSIAVVSPIYKNTVHKGKKYTDFLVKSLKANYDLLSKKGCNVNFFFRIDDPKDIAPQELEELKHAIDEFGLSGVSTVKVNSKLVKEDYTVVEEPANFGCGISRDLILNDSMPFLFKEKSRNRDVYFTCLDCDDVVNKNYIFFMLLASYKCNAKCVNAGWVLRDFCDEHENQSDKWPELNQIVVDDKSLDNLICADRDFGKFATRHIDAEMNNEYGIEDSTSIIKMNDLLVSDWKGGTDIKCGQHQLLFGMGSTFRSLDSLLRSYWGSDVFIDLYNPGFRQMHDKYIGNEGNFFDKRAKHLVARSKNENALYFYRSHIGSLMTLDRAPGIYRTLIRSLRVAAYDEAGLAKAGRQICNAEEQLNGIMSYSTQYCKDEDPDYQKLKEEANQLRQDLVRDGIIKAVVK